MPAAAKIGKGPDPETPERILGTDGGRAYRNFLAWSVGHGFAMAVIEVAAPRRRRELLAWTTAEMPGACVVALDQASGKPLRPLLEQACPDPGNASVMVLTRLEDAADRIKIGARLNLQRDELARAFPLPWVVLIHPAAALEMLQHAPDFSDFSGLWLREEEEGEETTGVDAFEPTAPSPQYRVTPAMRETVRGAAADLLDQAVEAITLSRYEEAMDLLAQHDMHHPERQSQDPRRIRLDGLLRRRQGQPDEALSQFEEALKLCTSAADTRLRAHLFGDIARVREDKGDSNAALDLNHQRLEIYEKLGDNRSRAGALADIARILTEKGDKSAALDLFQQALTIYQGLGDDRSQAVVLSNVARILDERGEANKAIDLLHQTLIFFEALGDDRSQAIALGDIARIYIDKGDLNAALGLLHQACKIFEELGDPDGVANARWSLGRITLEQGDKTAALEHFSASYALNLKFGRLNAICIVGSDLARLLLAEGRRAEALPILARSRDGFLHLGRPEQAKQAQALIDAAADAP